MMKEAGFFEQLIWIKYDIQNYNLSSTANRKSLLDYV